MQRQEEGYCCDCWGSGSTPACFCLLSAVEEGLRGRAAMFDSRRIMSFPEPVSSSGSSQWKDNFGQMSPLMASREAVVEASRCLFCFDKPCMLACPARIDVPGFIQQIRSGNLQGSARMILEANILGASCRPMWPAQALCDGGFAMHQ